MRIVGESCNSTSHRRAEPSVPSCLVVDSVGRGLLRGRGRATGKTQGKGSVEIEWREFVRIQVATLSAHVTCAVLGLITKMVLFMLFIWI